MLHLEQLARLSAALAETSSMPQYFHGSAVHVWQGYRLVHSAYGYGNETVLANDPHEQPFGGLDNPQAVERARQKSNTCVKCFRIGPWVFPIELTLKPLSAGDFSM